MIETNKMILDLSPNFHIGESWGDYSKVDPALIVLLQRIRTDLSVPIHINNAYEIIKRYLTMTV